MHPACQTTLAAAYADRLRIRASTRGAADSALAFLVWRPGKREDKRRVEQHRGRGHQVVNAGKGKVRTAVAVCGEPRQLSGPQTEEPLYPRRGARAARMAQNPRSCDAGSADADLDRRRSAMARYVWHA